MPAPTTHGFAEKVALIINGHEGIGRAVALQLALSGCYVIISYPAAYKEKANVINELTSLGTLANAFEFTDSKTLIDEVEKLYGRLDLLVNCLKFDEDSEYFITEIVDESGRLMKLRPKPTIVSVIVQQNDQNVSSLVEQTQRFTSQLLNNFRANLIVTKSFKIVQEHGLFESKQGVQNDDVARIVTFLLSNEAKALNGQVLYTH
jgi:NAD(P)-dependent dehydrogenase (short-subunit alcohol dehydrogenase family)